MVIREKSYSYPPLLPLLYNMSFVCKQDDCYHHFLRVTGTARAEKEKKSRPAKPVREAGKEKKYI